MYCQLITKHGAGLNINKRMALFMFGARSQGSMPRLQTAQKSSLIDFGIRENGFNENEMESDKETYTHSYQDSIRRITIKLYKVSPKISLVTS